MKRLYTDVIIAKKKDNKLMKELERIEGIPTMVKLILYYVMTVDK